MAILQWAGIAFEDWEKRFPLEPPLCSQLRRLKPLAATLALIDPDFLTPGGHPLHRVLDNLQLAAVGWQASLGRAGQALENALVSAVEEALTWFDTRDTDLVGTRCQGNRHNRAGPCARQPDGAADDRDRRGQD